MQTDLGKYKRDNGGIYWILTAVEILSSYAFAIPGYRPDTSNMTKAVTLLLKHFKDWFGGYPKLAELDDGNEFYNVGTLLGKYGVKYFSTNSDN